MKPRFEPATSALLLLALLLTSCTQPVGKSHRKSLDEIFGDSEALGDAKGPLVVGRFQTVVTGTKTLKVDTANGQTWILDTDSVWKTLPTDGSAENKTRVVAELVAEFLTKSFNTSTGQLEALSETEKKRRIDEVVKQALDTYEHPKTAEQYLRIRGVPKVGYAVPGGKVTNVEKVK
jgi:hypothetical protein